MTTDTLTTLLREEGLDTDRIELDRLAVQARSCGVSEILVSIMVDDRAPIAPRVRAFGRVSSRVAALQGAA